MVIGKGLPESYHGPPAARKRKSANRGNRTVENVCSVKPVPATANPTVTAAELAQSKLESDEFTTVGTAISIEHTSPTPLGAEVEATAVLTKTEGRMFYFELTASDNLGEIARGTHTRVSVSADKFQKKADAKFD